MHCIVVGAGFAGLHALKPLKKADERITVTVIDKNAYATMLPSLPDCAGGAIPGQYLSGCFNTILPRNIFFFRENVRSVDLGKKVVFTDHHEYGYDYVIIAAGSVTNFYRFDQNVDKIHALDSLDSALRIRDAFRDYLRKDLEKHTLVLVGAGYTGIELAVHLRNYANRLKRPCDIVMAEMQKEVMPFLTDHERTYVMNYLKRKNISILTDTEIRSFDGENVVLSNGGTVNTAFVCWTAGSKPGIPEIKGTVERIPDGRIVVNPYLQPGNYGNVFIAGDCAAIAHEKSYLRKAVNFAVYSGRCAGENCANAILDNPLKGFRPVDLGWILPLGEISVGRMAGKALIKGRPGLFLHYFMCGYRNFNTKNFLYYTLHAFRKLL